tara:strand:- start:3299 stop:4015 length:717 start_codon:yes stop_codon:yes gene_type:complete
MKNNQNFKIQIFADGADIKSIEKLNLDSKINGFTTNPSLMKKAGIKDYKKFAHEVLKIVKDKPISFEVFSDEINEMESQAKEINSWGNNIYVKIPITNSKGEKTTNLVSKLSKNNIKCNVTAVFTLEQVKEIYNAIDTNTETIISIFAGRIADSGLDPLETMKEALKICQSKKNIQILWASTRELYNIIQANNINCHIITVPHSILPKLDGIGKDLNDLSLDTVKSFLVDAKNSGYKI